MGGPGAGEDMEAPGPSRSRGERGSHLRNEGPHSPRKLGHKSSAVSLPCVSPTDVKTHVHSKTGMRMPRAAMLPTAKKGATPRSVGWDVHKQNKGVHSVGCCSTIKRNNVLTCYNRNVLKTCCQKPVTKGHILLGSVYMKCSKQANPHRQQISGCRGLRGRGQGLPGRGQGLPCEQVRGFFWG